MYLNTAFSRVFTHLHPFDHQSKTRLDVFLMLLPSSFQSSTAVTVTHHKFLQFRANIEIHNRHLSQTQHLFLYLCCRHHHLMYLHVKDFSKELICFHLTDLYCWPSIIHQLLFHHNLSTTTIYIYFFLAFR